MAQTNKSGETVRERLKTSDLIPRLLCVVIAVIIWLYVMSNESPDYERTFSGATVSIENAALLSNEYDLSVISGYGERADITVTGKKSDLISYSLENIVPSVDVGSITTPGKHQLSISVTTPDGCTVGSVSPTSIEVYIDQIATKTLPVVVNISQVQHEQSITLGVPTPDVTAVTVSGPASVIEAASRAVVDLALGELTTGVTARGTLHVVTEDGATVDNPYLTLSQTSVGVTVPVYIEREIPITVGTKYGYFNEDNTRITVSPKSLTVRADPALLEGVDAFEIATIDENQRQRDADRRHHAACRRGESQQCDLGIHQHHAQKHDEEEPGCRRHLDQEPERAEIHPAHRERQPCAARAHRYCRCADRRGCAPVGGAELQRHHRHRAGAGHGHGCGRLQEHGL